MIRRPINSQETRKPKTASLFTINLVIFLVVTFISSILFQEIRQTEYFIKFIVENFNICPTTITPNSNNYEKFTNTIENEDFIKFAVYQRDNRSSDEGHLKHILNIFSRMGLKRVKVQDEWDLLWAHDFPFSRLSQKLKNLEPHQKINHFPGCGFITNKVDLCTTDLSFLPKAFRLPEEKEKFIKFNNENPGTLFVVKHNEHRHIHIQSADEINLNSNNSFIQEFIDQPYLVDGYKFDIGVYVVITGISPLTIYIYTGDVLFRYCAEPYYPFNSSNIDKYVVGDDYLPTWKLPSLKIFHDNFKFGQKDTFDAYVKSKSENPKLIWSQVEKIIRETIMAKEKYIINILKSYKTKNFFELMRFDFIVDKNLRVYLMEANMSPNLSSAHYKQNSLLYEQILYSVMQLVGVGRPLKINYLKKQHNDIESMISSEKNLAVNSQKCLKNKCNEDCSSDECLLCLNCLHEEDLKVLHKAFREHIHRGDTKRIFPEPITEIEFNLEDKLKNLSPANKMLTLWFYEKCQMDNVWCV